MKRATGSKTWDERYYEELWYLYLSLPSKIISGKPLDSRGNVESAAQAVLNVAREKETGLELEFQPLTEAVVQLGQKSASLLEAGDSSDVASIISEFEATVKRIIVEPEESAELVQLIVSATELVNVAHKAASLKKENKAMASDILGIYTDSTRALASVLLTYAGVSHPDPEEDDNDNESEEEEKEEDAAAIGNILDNVLNVARLAVCKLPHYYKLKLTDTRYKDSHIAFFSGAHPLLTAGEKCRLTESQKLVQPAPLSFHLLEECSGREIQRCHGVTSPGVYFLEKSGCVMKPLGHLYQLSVSSQQRRYFTLCGKVGLRLTVEFRLSADSCENTCITALLYASRGCEERPYRYMDGLSGFFIDVHFQSRERCEKQEGDACGRPLTSVEAAISKIRIYSPFQC